MTTAKMYDRVKCKDCGWPVVFACCNYPFTKFEDSGLYDWWVYCSNKGCKNHHGEGIFQDTPEWMVKNDF